ncbi:GTP1/OBG domain [Dillenia turbinata]|uniref:GTP1/OBG domain n=1 Tax=Dillenia turbinata TaxID=194707 RepID=A0AAN8ZFE4_9MAGN
MAYLMLPSTSSSSSSSSCALNSRLLNHSHSASFSFFSAAIPFLPRRFVLQRIDSHIIRRCTIRCAVSKTKDSTNPNPSSLIREPHKYFDHVIVTVRSGDGGHGAILSMPTQRPPSSKGKPKQEKDKGKRKGSYKRDFDGSLILPMGGHGGDVVIYADEGLDSLLEFHKKNRYNAKRGGNVDAMGVLTSQLHDGFAAPTLRIPVPVGTVVKRRRGNFLADLTRPGDEILVARGGQGGISLLEMPEHRKKKLMAWTTNLMRDENDKVLVLGQPGEEVSLELILRVVADVGLVGLPNAGKSTLLAAITLAKPDIADYPFTTLMPNLGRLDGDPTLGAGKYSSGATLADLPGLIEGAHLGKGLGRNFLRHLRRTRLLVHVVDACAQDPINDYRTVKEELRMYNPDYLERPYVVVLNKIDLPEAKERLATLTQQIWSIGSDEVLPQSVQLNSDKVEQANGPHTGNLERHRKEKRIEDYARPLAVVGVSVLKGIKVNEMLNEIRAALSKCQDFPQALPSKVETLPSEAAVRGHLPGSRKIPILT